MIARLWRGRVPPEKAEAYLKLMQGVAIRDYRATPGNLGAWCLHRPNGSAVAVHMLTFWESKAAIAGFAGQDISQARYYDFDPDYLLAMPQAVDHYEILTGHAAGISLDPNWRG